MPTLAVPSLAIAPPRVSAVRLRRVAVELGWVAVAGLMFVCLLKWPWMVATDNPDAGWMQLLLVLHGRGAQAGVDYVFPYGPLGFLFVLAYDPATFTAQYVGEIAFKGLLAVQAVRVARQLRPAEAAGFLAATGGLGLILCFIESQAMAAAMAAGWLPVLKGRWTKTDLLLGPPVVAALGLAKFSLGVLAAGSVGVAVVFLLFTPGGWRSAVAGLALILAWTVGLGLLVGFDPRNLPAYVVGGMEYSASYNDGMFIPGPRLDLRLYGAAAVAAVVAVFAAGRAAFGRQALASAVLLAAAAFVAYKYGFVRHDGHAAFAFAMLITLLPLVPRAVPGDAPARPAALAAAAGFGLLGLWEVHTHFPDVSKPLVRSLVGEAKMRIDVLLDPAKLRGPMDEMREKLAARHALPRVRAAVGTERIECFTECQGVVLLNGLNVAPRPTLQSVNAVSAGMMERNRAYLAGPDAPRFVLLKRFVFDGRFPTLADGPAFTELLRRYRPLLEEEGFTLLERAAGEPPPGRDVASGEAAFEQEIAVPPAPPGTIQAVSFDIRRTAYGSARGTAFRPTIVWFGVKDDTGTWHSSRIIPTMAKAPFAVDPLLDTDDALTAAFTRTPGRRVVAVRVVVEGADKRNFRPTFRYTVTAYDR